jgi:type IV pilus assembly protein PilA
MLKKFITRVVRGQKGFTLIEMIVVVGIIAVLAAVIVPNIGRFIGSGEAGAKDAEWESVQTAMNAMMADQATTSVAAVNGAGVDSVGGTLADWNTYPEIGADPGALPLYGAAVGAPKYLQAAQTVYFYCWNGEGQITFQHEVADTCVP